MMNSSGKEGQGVIGLPKLLIPTESAIHKFLFVLLLGFKTLQHECKIIKNETDKYDSKVQDNASVLQK